MIQLMPAEPGAYRVVDTMDLWDLTRAGWQLVAIITQDVVETVKELLPPEHLTVRVEHARHCGWNGNQDSQWDRPVVKKVQRYLVRQVKDDLLTELHAEIAKGNTKVAKASNDAYLAKEELEATHKLLTTANEQLVMTRSALANAEGRERTLANTRQKLEGDIAKLRQAIGDLRMKEILGS